MHRPIERLLGRQDALANHCRRMPCYVKQRGKVGGARADLETLRAAINHHAKENLHYGIVRITLPAKGPPRDRWLTRSEAAKLIWACWRYREQQTVHRGRHKGQLIATDKRPLRHLARFILIGLYTGTRAGAIASASPYRQDGHSFVDLDQGIFYRLAIGRRATKKRQTPAPIPPRLLAHMRRWVRRGVVTSHFVEWQGGAGQIGQDRLQARGQTCRPVGQGNTAHAAAHGGDLADATWRADLAGCRLSRHVGRNGGAHLWPPSSRVHACCCAGDHVETIAERFIGHSIGQTGKASPPRDKKA